MPSILGANSATGGYDVDNSVRFNDDDTAYMHKTPDGAGNRRTFTFSTWVKRANLGAEMGIFTAGADANAGQFFTIMFTASDELDVQFYEGGFQDLTTSRVFRDVAAWYHIVVAVDTTQGTAANRIKVYVNGVQESSFDSSDYPGQNWDSAVNNTEIQQIGVRRNGSAALAGYYDGYLTETVLIDGSQLAADKFGEFDSSSEIWKPKNVSGLTFGTNGFYLDFQASDNLGNDANGGTDLTEVNIAAIDQTTDTCTNNFCTINFLDNYFSASTFSEGNCKLVTQSTGYQYNTGTFGLTSGKWYYEMKMTNHSQADIVGIAGRVSGGSLHYLGYYADTWGYHSYDGKFKNNNSGTSYGDAWVTNDTIVGVYIDLDNNKLYFSKNGTIQNSGTGITIGAASSTFIGAYFPAIGDNWNGDTGTYHMNFGNPTYTGTDQTDVNGYGSFEYDPSSGSFDSASKDFLAICTKNLAEFG
tara:strand:- start:1047 stop:2459 length:1413 start_codon:yes stop_codon:yes gene_type:complete